MPTKQATPVQFNVPARNVKQIPKNVAQKFSLDEMEKLGFSIAGGARGQIAKLMRDEYCSGMDTVQSVVTTSTIPNVVQFYQSWLTGQVHVMTAQRAIDTLIGTSTQGEFADEQVVQEVLENTGYAVPYQDTTNVPLSNWNLNFVPRTLVRFELGMRVGVLEEERAAKVRVSSAQSKRESCGLGLDIVRNLVGFNGYNSGNNNTYGFLNDPGLSAYVTVANSGTGSSTLWSQKTYLNIVQDLLVGFVQLRNQSQGNIDPKEMPTTLALPTNAIDYLATVSQFGNSVREWLTENYPKCRVVSAPQLNTANGGSGVFYIYADKVSDLSTDDGATWVQAVPTRFRVLGVAKFTKFFEEDYANATAGAMLKRPWALVRYTGIS